jgi:hypothetical protein
MTALIFVNYEIIFIISFEQVKQSRCTGPSNPFLKGFDFVLKKLFTLLINGYNIDSQLNFQKTFKFLNLLKDFRGKHRIS